MKYIYFVAYVNESNNSGNAQVKRDKKINKIDDIREIEKEITNYLGQKITLISFPVILRRTWK